MFAENGMLLLWEHTFLFEWMIFKIFQSCHLQCTCFYRVENKYLIFKNLKQACIFYIHIYIHYSRKIQNNTHFIIPSRYSQNTPSNWETNVPNNIIKCMKDSWNPGCFFCFVPNYHSLILKLKHLNNLNSDKMHIIIRKYFQIWTDLNQIYVNSYKTKSLNI